MHNAPDPKTQAAAALLAAHEREKAIEAEEGHRETLLRQQKRTFQADRRGRSGRGAAPKRSGRTAAGGPSGTCSGITSPQVRHPTYGGSAEWSPETWWVGLDWLETGCVIDWGATGDGETFLSLEPLRTAAQRNREPEPYAIDGVTWWVHGAGAGRGKESHCRYVLSTGPEGCLTVHLDARRSTGRKLYNGRFQCPGQACLRLGTTFARRQFAGLLESLGGRVTDEWVKRADLAVDAPRVSLAQEVAMPYRSGRIVGRARRSELHGALKADALRSGEYAVNGEPTGVAFGSRNWCRLVLYDKAEEVAGSSEEYQQAMQRERWGGTPDAATRIEWSVSHAWLEEYGVGDLEPFLGRLRDVGARMYGLPPHDSQRFVRICESIPDVANKHGNRVADSEFWQCVGGRLADWDGVPSDPLRRVDRDAITPERAAKVMASYAANLAAARGHRIEDVPSLIAMMSTTLPLCGVGNDYIRERWEAHAMRRGLLEEDAASLATLGVWDQVAALQDAVEEAIPSERVARLAAEESAAWDAQDEPPF